MWDLVSVHMPSWILLAFNSSAAVLSCSSLAFLLWSPFYFFTPIILPLGLISWSYLSSHSRPFHGLLLITPISFTFIYHMQIFIDHISFTFVSPLFHFLLWCSIAFYAQPCTAVHSCAQPHLVVYIFSSLHWCTPVLTLSISWSVIDARLSLAYRFPTEYWPHLVIQSA